MEQNLQDRTPPRPSGSRLAALSFVAAMALSLALLGQLSASLPGADRPIQSVAWLFGPAEAATSAR